MIISFKNINGGSGPVDVPIATTGRTGVVKIGEGINVDSAGTISVTGGTIEEMPISPFISKDLNANGRCFSKEVEFSFEIYWDDSGQTFNNYTFNPYLSIKQLNGRNWDQTSYLDIYITKGEQDEYPTFKLVNGYNIGQGFVSEKLIEETLDFNIGIEGEYNQAEFDIRDFLLRADSRYGSQDYTVKGLKVEIISDGINRAGRLKFKMDSNNNQTFLNYLTLPNDAYNYNVHIFQTFVTTLGHYPIATNGNVGMVQIGTGFTYSNNNGSLSVPTASQNQTGIVRIGDGLDIDENGVLSDKDDVKVVSELPTTSVTETIGSIWYVGQEQTGDFTYMAGNGIEIRKGNTNPQENITLFKIESYQNYTTLTLTPDGTYIVTDESGTEHYLNDGDFLEISGTNVTYTFSNMGIMNITISEDKEIVDVYVDTPVIKTLAVGEEGDIVAMVDASENLCFYEIVNQEWSEKYAHNTGGGGGIEVVSQLPASGTDGQVVVLNNHSDTEITIDESGKNPDTYIVSVTANNVTEQTLLYNYGWWGEYVNVYVEEGNAVTLESQRSGTSETFDVGTVDGPYTMVGDYDNTETLMINVYETGFTIEQTQGVEKNNFIKNVEPSAEYKLYKWCDEETPSIDAVISNDGYMIEIFYDEIPAYTESAFTVVKVSVMEEAPKVELEYRNGNFYNLEYGNENTPLIDDGQIHIGPWANTLYLISDGYIKLISNNGVIKIVDTDLWNGQMNVTGWTEYGRKGVVYSGKNCYLDFPVNINGNRVNYEGISNIYVPTEAGNNGQILKSNGSGVYWDNLVIPKTEIYQSLPYGGTEGDLALTNYGYSPTTASTFIAMNSTSESDKNNFSNDNELGWYDWGNNNYIYFGNASAYTNTKDTFLYRIAMRTNENSDWNTSELAYINVVKADDTYEIFMDNFNYYDTGGTPVPYTFNFTLSSTGTTSGNTPYLPLWKWWDGGFGYKFHFEIDQDNNLKMWMKHSYADSEQQDPDYVQGQNYGDTPVKCMDHTETFYSISLDQANTYFNIYKGGVWYELGYLNQMGV